MKEWRDGGMKEWRDGGMESDLFDVSGVLASLADDATH